MGALTCGAIDPEIFRLHFLVQPWDVLKDPGSL